MEYRNSKTGDVKKMRFFKVKKDRFRQDRKMRKNAFTLIELLVVIAIIALLLAVIVPSLQKAKDYAKRTICTSNAKQTGVGLRVYAQSNDDELIPMRDQNGVIQESPMPWEAVLAYSPTYLDSTGKAMPIGLAELYESDLISTPEIFYCPAQPRNGDYPIPYYYDFYTNEGTQEWGSFFPVPAAGSGHVWVRTSFNYWTYSKKRYTELHATKPILVDNLQEWEVIPHRKARSAVSLAEGVPNPNSVPQGVTALFTDGHVNFCIGNDIFEKDIWPLQSGYYNGPGNRVDDFQDILRVIQGHQ